MRALWARVRLIAEWIFDQFIYPWIAGVVNRSSDRQARKWARKRAQ